MTKLRVTLTNLIDVRDDKNKSKKFQKINTLKHPKIAFYHYQSNIKIYTFLTEIRVI